MPQTEKYLKPEDDGLPCRPAKPYVHYKLKALEVYLTMVNTAMRDKWPKRRYIDLQAGPGKNQIGGAIVLGSPLISLTIPHPATHFIFNELDPQLCNALRQRVSASELQDQVTIFQADLNEIVGQICDEISAGDRRASASGKWSSLNVAFLDPEGLELHWQTVERLAQMSRMDLIITFPTGGLLRTIGRGYLERVDEFFGTTGWRSVYDQSRSWPRRALIDFYRQNLEKFGYHIDIDRDLPRDYIAVNNSRNAQVYSLIFASKHPLADKFWRQAAKSVQPRKLPGFELE